MSIEEGPELQLDFTKLERLAGSHVVPCAVQDVTTMEAVLVAYVNEEALRRAVETRSAVFWSTSRNELWEKGKSSGESFDLVDVLVNCEQNSLVYRVGPGRGGICHTKNAGGQPRNCYYRASTLTRGASSTSTHRWVEEPEALLRRLRRRP
jgi:phosphoribosyl-AMP cyclohydrolase